MKYKIKLLIIVTGLATGNANAAIDTATTGNGELFFTIWDKVAQIAYTKDLGIRMNDFLPGTANASANQSFSLAGDEYWTGFLSLTDPTSTVWMIGAMDGTNKIAPGGSRYLTTSKSGLSAIRNQSNLGLFSFDVSNNFLLAVNNYGTHPTQAEGSSLTNKANNGNAYPQSIFYNMETWSTKASGWTSTANVSDKLNFYYLTTSSSSALGKVTIGQYGTDANTAATWSVNVGANTLEYTAPTPIPAAAWLLGSALVGLVGVGRRQGNANVIAA